MESMSLALSGRAVLTAVLTMLGLVAATLAGYVLVVVLHVSGEVDLDGAVRSAVVWRSVVVGVVVLTGTRLACGIALRRGAPGAVGASATGMVLAGVALAGLTFGHLLFGQLILDGDAARALVDLVLWCLTGAVGLVWAQLRVTPATETRYPARARATSWR